MGKRQHGEAEDSQADTSLGRKRLRVNEGTSLLDKLPTEMLLEVFKHLPLEDVTRLGKETAMLNAAARIHTKLALLGLRRSIVGALQFLTKTLKDLPMNRDHLRISIVKSFCLARYTSTEIELLFANVWRFRDDEEAWNMLAPHLTPVVYEFESFISRINVNLGTARTHFPLYRMMEVLVEWRKLVKSMENGLSTTLESVATNTTPYEIRVIDTLMCAPSFGFQLALHRIVGQNWYNVFGFFKTNNLKPVCQVPEVFNSELNVKQKKMLLLSYLRETVQHENCNHLAGIFNRIYELEESQQNNLNQNLHINVGPLFEEYRMLQDTPLYQAVLKKCRFQVPDNLYEEYYIRCPNENLSFTGLRCIVQVPQQEIHNLPLAIPFLRGHRPKLYDHFECEAMEGMAELSNSLPQFIAYPSYTKLSNSRGKPTLQLIIHYRESYRSQPSEVVINIGYGDGECCITFDQITGEVLEPLDLG